MHTQCGSPAREDVFTTGSEHRTASPGGKRAGIDASQKKLLQRSMRRSTAPQVIHPRAHRCLRTRWQRKKRDQYEHTHEQS